MALRIESLTALQVLESRGRPTIQVAARLSDGSTASAIVPSGASTGTHEALELRDNDPAHYEGRSVFRAVSHVEDVLARELRRCPADDQAALDQRMIEIDGSANKGRLGANSILGVSMAVARAVARSRGLPLWRHLSGGRPARMPVPMVNILSGGLHAGRQIEFQDFLAVPHGFDSVAQSIEAAVRVHCRMEELLRKDGLALTGVADEGGWGPPLPNHKAALDYMVRAIRSAGFEPGLQVSLALDVAATHFYREGIYELASERRTLQASEMIELFAGWLDEYPILSIEDGLAEDDWEGWRQMTSSIGKRCRLIGDDLFVTNPERLERGIRFGAANAVLVKMNQIGTLTETFHVIDRAHEAGFMTVISARSGDTEDDFLADLAVASGSGQIKIGSVTRSERLAKYNRLLQIEDQSRRSGQGPEPFAVARKMLRP